MESLDLYSAYFCLALWTEALYLSQYLGQVRDMTGCMPMLWHVCSLLLSRSPPKGALAQRRGRFRRHTAGYDGQSGSATDVFALLLESPLQVLQAPTRSSMAFSWQACSSLLPRASKVAPQRKAEDTAEGAAGYDGQECSAADVFVLLLKRLRQALHALSHTSAFTQSR